MNAQMFLRDLVDLCSRYNVKFSDIQNGEVTIGYDKVLLNTLVIDKNIYSAQIVQHIEESIGYDMNASPQRPIVRIIHAGEHPKNCCLICRSSLQTKWWGLIRTDKCINPSCSNYYDRGFEVLQPTPEESALSNIGNE